jgi:hypothetical protein
VGREVPNLVKRAARYFFKKNSCARRGL